MGGVCMCLYVYGAQSEVLSDGAGKLPMWRKWSKKKKGGGGLINKLCSKLGYYNCPLAVIPQGRV